jgi:hypothetical protein
VKPPSTGSATPSTKLPAGTADPEDGRGNLVRSAESSDRLIPHDLLHGVGPLWSISATMGVSIVPGHTAMMRTALEAYSSASARRSL